MLLSDRFKLLRQRTANAGPSNRSQPQKRFQSANNSNNGRFYAGRQMFVAAQKIKKRTIQQRLGNTGGQVKRQFGAKQPKIQPRIATLAKLNQRVKLNRNNYKGVQKVITTQKNRSRSGFRKPTNQNFNNAQSSVKPKKTFHQANVRLHNGKPTINRKMTMKQKQTQRIRQATLTNTAFAQRARNNNPAPGRANKKQNNGNRNNRVFKDNANKAMKFPKRQPKATKESLDSDLDKYMAKTKSSLDFDIDAYMSHST